LVYIKATMLRARPTLHIYSKTNVSVSVSGRLSGKRWTMCQS